MSQKTVRQQSSNQLPWILEDADDDFGTDESVDEDAAKKPATEATFDLNMRNYNSAIDLPIKSIKQLRQQTD